jgi:hypothetical protein
MTSNGTPLGFTGLSGNNNDVTPDPAKGDAIGVAAMVHHFKLKFPRKAMETMMSVDLVEDFVEEKAIRMLDAWYGQNYSFDKLRKAYLDAGQYPVEYGHQVANEWFAALDANR